MSYDITSFFKRSDAATSSSSEAASDAASAAQHEDKRPNPDASEFAWRLYNAPTNGIADVRMQIT